MREAGKDHMNYEEWSETVPLEIQGDSLWKMEAYRLALFASEVGWRDVSRLIKDCRTIGLSDQLYRALGSVHANLSEGYSRSSSRDRARFYEYALGSAREARGWYYNGRHVLGDEVCSHRLGLLTQIIRLLLTMVPDQRGDALREEALIYGSTTDDHSAELASLLSSVPNS
jgi:four helix bundle protein